MTGINMSEAEHEDQPPRPQECQRTGALTDGLVADPTLIATSCEPDGGFAGTRKFT